MNIFLKLTNNLRIAPTLKSSLKISSTQTFCLTSVANQATILEPKHSYTVDSKNQIGITEELLSRYMQLKTKLDKFSPYVIFLTDEAKKRTIEKKNDKNGNTLLNLSRKWNKLSYDERIVYFNARERLVQESNDQLASILSGLDADQRVELDRLRAVKEFEAWEKKLKSKMNTEFYTDKRIIEYKKPRRAPIPFAIYYREKIKEYQKAEKETFNEATKMALIAERWRNLSATEKEEYTQKWKAETESYVKKTKEWEERMIAEGSEHLVVPQKLMKKKELIASREEKRRVYERMIKEKLKKAFEKAYYRSTFLTESIEKLEKELDDSSDKN